MRLFGFLRFLRRLLEDECGFWQEALIPAAAGAAGSIMGTFGKGKKVPQGAFGPITGRGTAERYEQIVQRGLGDMWTDEWLGATPYGGGFDIPQPEVEKTAEETILGKLRDLPSVGGFSKDITDKYKGYELEAAKERAAERMEEEKQMYNRLGLVSSTPWLGRRGELGGELSEELGGIESRYAYEDIGREIEATRLADEIAQGWTGQAGGLGQAQRGYAMYPMEKGYEEFLRTSPEYSPWLDRAAELMSIFSGAYRPATETPGTTQKFGSALQDIGGAMMMYNLMKK